MTEFLEAINNYGIGSFLLAFLLWQYIKLGKRLSVVEDYIKEEFAVLVKEAVRTNERTTNTLEKFEKKYQINED